MNLQIQSFLARPPTQSHFLSGTPWQEIDFVEPCGVLYFVQKDKDIR